MKNRDTDYLGSLRDYYAREGVLPSFSGIASLVGLKTTSAVSVMVGRLKEEGFLASTPDRRLQPGPRFFERPVSEGQLPAGLGTPDLDAGSSALSIDAYLITQPSITVLATVKGESMIEAGLFDGDHVVVKRGVPTSPGDIVVARIDGDWTIKFLAKSGSAFFLKAGNPRYPDLHPKAELLIYGRVDGSFRRYRAA